MRLDQNLEDTRTLVEPAGVELQDLWNRSTSVLNVKGRRNNVRMKFIPFSNKLYYLTRSLGDEDGDPKPEDSLFVFC